MNDKFKRLAKNLSELVRLEDETLQATYDVLRKIMSRQQDYFGNFPAENILKLTFYVWSYNKTGDFVVADKILNDIAFAAVFTTEGEKYETECDYCDGNGSTSCDNCGGTGSFRCDTCDGSGNEECSQCGGSGQESCSSCDGEGTDEEGDTCAECEGTGNVECDHCDGAGSYACTECNGDGDISCNDCDGDGSQECYECDGNGMIDSGELIYNVYQIVTWSKFIKERCELTEQSAIITMSEYDFDRLRDDYIVLVEDNEHGFLQDIIEENEMYCVYYSDNPKIFLQPNNMTIFFEYDMIPYLNK